MYEGEIVPPLSTTDPLDYFHFSLDRHPERVQHLLRQLEEISLLLVLPSIRSSLLAIIHGGKGGRRGRYGPVCVCVAFFFQRVLNFVVQLYRTVILDAGWDTGSASPTNASHPPSESETHTRENLDRKGWK